MELEEGARCWVAGVTFPNVFYTIEEGVDDVWYAAIENGGVTGGYAFKLAYGNYGGAELAAEKQTKLRTVDATAQVTYASRTGKNQIVVIGIEGPDGLRQEGPPVGRARGAPVALDGRLEVADGVVHGRDVAAALP